MDPDASRRRLTMFIILSIFFLLVLKDDSPSPEEMKRQRFGDIEIEYLDTNPNPNPDTQPNNVRIHLFKPSIEQKVASPSMHMAGSTSIVEQEDFSTKGEIPDGGENPSNAQEANIQEVGVKLI
jgi:hypothetical protein